MWKVCCAKLSRFSRFSRVSQKFSHEYNHLSLIILNNKHFWPRQHKSVSIKISTQFKLRKFSPVNLYTSMVYLKHHVYKNFINVTQHVKIGIMCTKLTPSHYSTYHIVKKFGSKKVWQIRTVTSLAEKTLANQ